MKSSRHGLGLPGPVRLLSELRCESFRPLLFLKLSPGARRRRMARRCRASAYLHQKMRGTRKSGITDRFGATDAPRAARARIRIAANQDLTAAVGCIPGTRKSWLPHVEKEEEKEAPVS